MVICPSSTKEGERIMESRAALCESGHTLDTLNTHFTCPATPSPCPNPVSSPPPLGPHADTRCRCVCSRARSTG